MSDLARRQAIVEGPKANWAGGLTLFGGTMLVLLGVVGFLQGLSAVLTDDVFAEAPDYALGSDLATWGWVHIALAVAAMVVGAAVLKVRTWGLVAGMVIAGLSAVVNFLLVPRSESWGLVALGLCLAVVWAFSEAIHENRALAALESR